MAFILGYLVVVVMSALLEQDLSAGRVVPFYNDGNPNALAIPTVFLVPFVVYFALDQWRKGRRLSVLAATGAALYLLLWALTASASRGATAATIVSLLLFVAFGRGLELWRVLARIGLVALFVTAAGAGVYWTSAFPDTLKSRIEGSIASEQDQRLSDERAALNRAGVQAFLESPLIGTGFDNFRYVAQFYDDEATFHDPHNLLIQFLAQTGLVGAAAVLFIFVRWFVLLVRTQSIAVTRSQRELLWAFVAGMAGLMIHSTVAPLILHRHYWLLYGLGIAAAVQLPLETESAASGGPGGGTSTSGPRPRSASG
jgi:O-antigen ligase